MRLSEMIAAVSKGSRVIVSPDWIACKSEKGMELWYKTSTSYEFEIMPCNGATILAGTLRRAEGTRYSLCLIWRSRNSQEWNRKRVYVQFSCAGDEQGFDFVISNYRALDSIIIRNPTAEGFSEKKVSGEGKPGSVP